MTEDPGIGHNSGDEFEQLRDRANEFGRGAVTWGKNSCDTGEDAEALNAYISEARALYKELDTLRKEEKRPHDEAAKAVQAKFNPLLYVVKKAAETAKDLMDSYLERKEAELRHQAEAEAKAQAEAARKAEEERQAAEDRGDMVAVQEAEKAVQDHTLAVEKALEATTTARAQSKSETGRTISLRTVRDVTITRITQAMLHYKDHPDMIALVERLAKAEVRSGATDIPGVEITERKVAA